MRQAPGASKLKTCDRAACSCSCRWRWRSLPPRRARRARRTSTRAGAIITGGRPGIPAGPRILRPAARTRVGPRGRRRPRPEGPSPAVLIERYTRVVLSQPGAAFPLQRLAQLYRERDGNIAKLGRRLRDARGAARGRTSTRRPSRSRGLYKLDGRTDDAIDDLREGHRAQARATPPALLALAHLFQDRGDVAARARALREGAAAPDGAGRQGADAPHAHGARARREGLGRRASGFHKQLVALEPTSLFVKGELGRELYNRGEYERAEGELKDVVAAAAGDNRALAPALKDLGRAQAKAHENAEALATLKRALATAGRAERAPRGDLRDRHGDLPRRPAAARARQAARGRAPERLRAPRAARRPLRGDGRLGASAIATYRRALAHAARGRSTSACG